MGHDSSELKIPLPRIGTVHLPRSDEYSFAFRNEYQPFFFTFGAGQAFPNGCVCIWAADELAARVKMQDLFGDKWCSCYDKEGVTRYLVEYYLSLVAEYVA